MSPTDAPQELLEPRHPNLLAVATFVVAALTLCWPMIGGGFLLGDDQYVAGYSFRLFGAEMFRQDGSVPQWNPYLFGGLPFIAAMHGDIFYPTAWLRWVLPVDMAMNLGFAIHLILAGFAMYLFLRALRAGWAAAVVGGLAYELTGIVASLVKPGHDGKLFVSALAPLVFLSLLRAIRGRDPAGYALFALLVGLCILSPQYQMAYYLLVAAGIWTIYLTFFDIERPHETRWPVALGLALAGVGLGAALAAIQILPFLAYIPYSPRGEGGPSGGWEYAISYSMPPEELVTAVLPQFNGMLEKYWGRSYFKLHTEYLGAVVVALAALGLGDRSRGRLIRALGVITVLFLLISLGGYTPFYRLWYEVMPMMKKVRAPGMAFYLVALPIAVFAAFGAERLLRREVTLRAALLPAGALGVLALLGVTGVLEGIATLFVAEQQAPRLAASAPDLRTGSLRLLAVAALSAGVFWGVLSGRLGRYAAVAALGAAVVLDLWSIDRRFFDFKPPAAELFADDAITTRLRQEPKPFRVLDAGVYPGAILMAHRVQTVLGYHGVEVRYYDDLLGGKNEWRNLGSPNLHELLAVRFLLLPDSQTVPGFHPVTGPAQTRHGSEGILYQRDTVPDYVRVVAAAAKLPEEQVVPTVIDPRFPLHDVVLLTDTASVSPEPIRGGAPDTTAVRARLTDWRPGSMRIALEGSDARPTYLLVSETWYQDWHALVDGSPAPVHRGNHALMTVVVPPGAREVALDFESPEYARGKLISLLALIAIGGLYGGAVVLRRRRAHV
ncbi:YfhO family protein [soil metagenome]